MELESVRAAEEALLSASVRADPEMLRRMLHPDFVEIGRSGRRWNRDVIIAELADDPGREAGSSG